MTHVFNNLPFSLKGGFYDRNEVEEGFLVIRLPRRTKMSSPLFFPSLHLSWPGARWNVVKVGGEKELCFGSLLPQSPFTLRLVAVAGFFAGGSCAH